MHAIQVHISGGEVLSVPPHLKNPILLNYDIWQICIVLFAVVIGRGMERGCLPNQPLLFG